MAGIFGEIFLVSVSNETKHENSSKKSGKIRSKIRGKIQDENSRNSEKLALCKFSDLRFFTADEDRKDFPQWASSSPFI